MSKHTPTPWIVLGPRSDGRYFIKKLGQPHSNAVAVVSHSKVDAEFIVRACNSHDGLLAALEMIVAPTARPWWELDASTMALRLQVVHNLAQGAIDKAKE